MLILRKILLYDYLYYGIFIIALLFTIIKINTDTLDLDLIKVTGVITDIYVDSDKCQIELETDDYNLLGTYYFSNYEDCSYELGDVLLLDGEISLPSTNTNPNLFNYRNYLKSKNISYVMNITSIKLVKNNSNIFYKIKNYLSNRIDNSNLSSYLYIFILGDNRYLDETIKTNYQNIGISHLFSISGMHISILTGITIGFLKRIGLDENKRYLLTIFFIIFYMSLVNFCPSALRSGLFFILLTINSIYYFNIKVINILILTISLILFNNPFIVYNTGFLYSSIITASLVLFGDLINKFNNYFIKILITSFIAFMFSLPISIYNYFQINILSIFYNIIFVPIVSIIIFPLSLITLFFEPFSYLLNIFIIIIENIASICSNINSNIIFNKPNLLVIFIYYLVIFCLFRYHNKFTYIIFIIILLVHYNYNIIFPSNYILMIDIGQGDSILLHSGKYNILIDTGGNSYSSSSISDTTLIPLFKSLGIRKIDYLFLTHGDYDHVGECLNLINDFKVEYVYFNEGDFSSNEEIIIEVLEEKEIDYSISYEKDSYKIGDFTLYSLNTDLNDENDSSLIIYGLIDKYNFLLMGDASKISEERLLNNYNLPTIDILKVGHHGSNTSSSSSFISKIKPKYAIISAGLDNKFGHPNQEVLDTLDEYNVKYYITSIDGAILINFKKEVTFSTFGT